MVLRDGRCKYVHFGESATWPPLLSDLQVATYPIVTSGEQLLNMIGDLV